MEFVKKYVVIFFYLFGTIALVYFGYQALSTGDEFFLSENEANIHLNSKYQIEIDNMSKIEKKLSNFTYYSKNEDIATVDSNGLVTPKKSGTVVIVVKNGSYKEEIKINISGDKVVLLGDYINVNVGETYDINNFIKKKDNSVEYKYSISDTSIAEIDEYGIITGKREGDTSVSIYIKEDEKTTVNVHVEKKIIEVESISFNKTSIKLYVGDSTTIDAYIYPKNASDTEIKWTTNNENIIVDKNGKITAVREGSSIIIATASNGIDAKCMVSVFAKPKPNTTKKAVPTPAPTTKKVVPTTKKVTPTTTLPPTTKPTTTTTRTTTTTKKATTTTKKTTTTTKKTTTKKTTTTTKKTTTKKTTTTTKKATPTTVTLNTTDVTLNVGKTYQLKATVKPTSKTVYWNSSDNSIAVVDSYGLVTAIKAGKCDITARSAGGSKAVAHIVVKSKNVVANRIDVSDSSITLSVGETKSVTASVYPTNATNSLLTWSSSDPAIATVSSGVIKGAKAGNCKITVKNKDNVSSYISVTVKPKVVNPSTVKFNKTTATIVSTRSLTIKATVNPSNADNKKLTWNSSDSSIASVDKNGVVTAKKSGTVKITAKTHNNKSAVATITVRPIDIILIGNSKTYRNPNKYPSVYNIFSEMMKKKYSANVYKAAVDGSSLYEKAKGKCISTCSTSTYNNLLSNAKKTITNKKYDVAILQERTDSTYNMDYYASGVKELKNLILNKNSSTVIYLRQSWYYRSRYVDGSYKNRQKKANMNANDLANTYKLKVIKDGQAFFDYYDKYKDVGLFIDNTHGSNDGVYLASLCMYKTITGDKASNVKYNGKVSSSRADKLKTIADSACK